MPAQQVMGPASHKGVQLGFEPAVDVVLLVAQDELNLLCYRTCGCRRLPRAAQGDTQDDTSNNQGSSSLSLR